MELRSFSSHRSESRGNELAPNRSAVIGTGIAPTIASPFFLPIQGLSLQEAIQQLPNNIQTIGHAWKETVADQLLCQLGARGVKRLVPLATMHHFGEVWDGYEFWSQMFECMEVVS